MTRRNSRRAAPGSATLRSPNDIVTASKASSANGRRIASAAVNGRSGRRRLAHPQHPEREVARHDVDARRRRTARLLVPVPAAMSSTRSPGRGHAPRRRPGAKPVLAEGEDVVGDVVRAGDVVEHGGDVAAGPCRGGAVHARHPPSGVGGARVAGTPASAVVLTRDDHPARDRRHVDPLAAAPVAPLVRPARPLARRPARRCSRCCRVPRPDGCARWVRRGEGLVGLGPRGDVRRRRAPDRFADAEAWWRDVVAQRGGARRGRAPGTGPVAFGSLSYAADSAGRGDPGRARGRRGPARRPVVGDDRSASRRAPAAASRRCGAVEPPRGARSTSRFADGALSPARVGGRVAEAVRRISRGRARQGGAGPRPRVATPAAPVDPRWLLRRLAERYADAGRSPSTGWSAPPPSCSSGARRAWSRRGCWPAPSGAPATTPTTWRWPRRSRGPARTSRSTSTPCARWPTRSPRTARR